MTVVVRGAVVLPMTGGDPTAEIHDGAVVVDGDRIVAVQPWADARRAHPGAEVVGDGTGIVLPGFVNGHTHLSEGLLSGMGEDMTLAEWGARTVGAAGPHITTRMADVGARLCVREALLSGTTTLSDLFCHGNVDEAASLGVLAALRDTGIRAVVSFGPEDHGYDGIVPGDPALISRFLDEHRALVAGVAGHARLSARIGLGTIGGATDALIGATVEFAAATGLAVHTHLAETREEITQSRLVHDAEPLERAIRLGLFDVPVLCAHAIWLTERDIARLVEHRATIVHNPVANMILADGVCAVPRLRAAGLPVALGTDGACSNDGQDMLQTIKAAPLLQKVTRHDPRVLTARDALAMATIEGARALGLDAIIGSLEPGKQADVIRIAAPYAHDAAQHVVYASGARHVVDVFVAGEALVRDGALVHPGHCDVDAVAGELAADLARAADLPGTWR